MKADSTPAVAPVADDAPPQEPEWASARPRRRRFVLALLTLALGLVVAASVGLAAGRQDRNRLEISAEGPAPAFDLPRLGVPGERVSLNNFRGTPVVMNFWASWCVPCRAEMPALQAVYETVRGEVAFVGVAHQDSEAAAADFAATVGVQYPSALDPRGDVAKAYGLYGLPSTILVDRDGTIVARRLGEVTEAELEDLMRRAFGVQHGVGQR